MKIVNKSPQGPPEMSRKEALRRSLFFHHSLFFLGGEGGPYPQHMKIPRLGSQWKLQLPAYATTTATATATQDPSHVCNLHHSSQQHQILNPLSKV